MMGYLPTGPFHGGDGASGNAWRRRGEIYFPEVLFFWIAP